jgi:hypothetical protein
MVARGCARCGALARISYLARLTNIAAQQSDETRARRVSRAGERWRGCCLLNRIGGPPILCRDIGGSVVCFVGFTPVSNNLVCREILKRIWRSLYVQAVRFGSVLREFRFAPRCRTKIGPALHADCWRILESVEGPKIAGRMPALRVHRCLASAGVVFL